jgi:hypothetical protein
VSDEAKIHRDTKQSSSLLGRRRWGLSRWAHGSHDHSKDIIGRDDGSASRQDDWWEERPPVYVSVCVHARTHSARTHANPTVELKF